MVRFCLKSIQNVPGPLNLPHFVSPNPGYQPRLVLKRGAIHSGPKGQGAASNTFVLGESYRFFEEVRRSLSLEPLEKICDQKELERYFSPITGDRSSPGLKKTQFVTRCMSEDLVFTLFEGFFRIDFRDLNLSEYDRGLPTTNDKGLQTPALGVHSQFHESQQKNIFDISLWGISSRAFMETFITEKGGRFLRLYRNYYPGVDQSYVVYSLSKDSKAASIPLCSGLELISILKTAHVISNIRKEGLIPAFVSTPNVADAPVFTVPYVSFAGKRRDGT